MGRLRDGFDAPLFHSVSEEVIELFGNEDGYLHRLDTETCDDGDDVLWNEPSGRPNYKKFRVAFLIQDYTTPVEVDDLGREDIYEATIFVARKHLEKSGVPIDAGGNYVRPGDIFETWSRGDRHFWNIIGTDRMGYVNDSDNWTHYNITARRTSKYDPERDLNV